MAGSTSRSPFRTAGTGSRPSDDPSDLPAALPSNEDGKVENFDAVVQNITERKKLELAVADS